MGGSKAAWGIHVDTQARTKNNLTCGMTELNVVRVARGHIIGIQHECPDAVLQLDRDAVVLVGGNAVPGCECIGIVCSGIRDLTVWLCAKAGVSVAQLLGFGLLKDCAYGQESSQGEDKRGTHGVELDGAVNRNEVQKERKRRPRTRSVWEWEPEGSNAVSTMDRG